jgi:hypothetical protein
VLDSIPPDFPQARLWIRLALGAEIPPNVELYEFAHGRRGHRFKDSDHAVPVRSAHRLDQGKMSSWREAIATAGVER